MQATNFEYDGQLLSDYHFIACDFDRSGGVSVVSTGYDITFNKVPHHRGKLNSLSSTKYDDCITTTFDICKDPSIFSESEMEITDIEYRAVTRWLHRRTFNKLYFIDECNDAIRNYFYNASFNTKKLDMDGKTYGIRLEMITDSPFAYIDEYIVDKTVQGASDSLVVQDISDELGMIYPDIEIQCLANGTYTITNETTGSVTVIKNCRYGEVISMNGKLQIIQTSYDAHDIANDFNYVFLTIENNMFNRDNSIKSSLACNMTIRYTPLVSILP